MTPKHEKGYNEFMNLTAFEQYLSVTDQDSKFILPVRALNPNTKNSSQMQAVSVTLIEPVPNLF